MKYDDGDIQHYPAIRKNFTKFSTHDPTCEEDIIWKWNIILSQLCVISTSWCMPLSFFYASSSTALNISNALSQKCFRQLTAAMRQSHTTYAWVALQTLISNLIVGKTWNQVVGKPAPLQGSPNLLSGI